MELHGFWEVFGVGAAGCSAMEVLRWWKLRDKAVDTFKPASLWFYLGISFLMIGLSGLVAVLNGIEKANGMTVFQLGATVPAFLGTLATGKSTGSKDEIRFEGEVPKRDATRQDIANFIAFRDA